MGMIPERFWIYTHICTGRNSHVWGKIWLLHRFILHIGCSERVQVMAFKAVSVCFRDRTPVSAQGLYLSKLKNSILTKSWWPSGKFGRLFFFLACYLYIKKGACCFSTSRLIIEIFYWDDIFFIIPCSLLILHAFVFKNVKTVEFSLVILLIIFTVTETTLEELLAEKYLYPPLGYP